MRCHDNMYWKYCNILNIMFVIFDFESEVTFLYFLVPAVFHLPPFYQPAAYRLCNSQSAFGTWGEWNSLDCREAAFSASLMGFPHNPRFNVMGFGSDAFLPTKCLFLLCLSCQPYVSHTHTQKHFPEATIVPSILISFYLFAKFSHPHLCKSLCVGWHKGD